MQLVPVLPPGPFLPSCPSCLRDLAFLPVSTFVTNLTFRPSMSRPSIRLSNPTHPPPRTLSPSFFLPHATKELWSSSTPVQARRGGEVVAEATMAGQGGEGGAEVAGAGMKGLLV
jgi:hypothetical protein